MVGFFGGQRASFRVKGILFGWFGHDALAGTYSKERMREVVMPLLVSGTHSGPSKKERGFGNFISLTK